MTQEKSYVVADSLETIKELVEHILEHDMIAYDTETDSLNTRRGKIIGFSVSGEIGKGYYMPTMEFKDDQLQEIIIDGKPAHSLAKYIIGKLVGKKLVTHNGSFDCRMTKSFYGIDLIPYIHIDTGLLVHTVKEEGAFGYGNPFGLKSIAKMIQAELGLDTNEEANQEQIELKESIKRNGGSTSKDNYEIYKADMAILAKYAAADADLTLRIANHYLPVLEQEGLEKFFFEDEVMPVYREVTIPMEEHGIRLDIPLMEETKAKIVADLEKHADLVVEALLQNGKVRTWIIEQAVEAYPPKNKGTFAQRLPEQNEIELPRSATTGKFTINKAAVSALPASTIKDYLITGDVEYLAKEQIVKVAFDSH